VAARKAEDLRGESKNRASSGPFTPPGPWVRRGDPEQRREKCEAGPLSRAGQKQKGVHRKKRQTDSSSSKSTPTSGGPKRQGCIGLQKKRQNTGHCRLRRRPSFHEVYEENQKKNRKGKKKINRSGRETELLGALKNKSVRIAFRLFA